MVFSFAGMVVSRGWGVSSLDRLDGSGDPQDLPFLLLRMNEASLLHFEFKNEIFIFLLI
jgi:hypothetical protein